MKMTNCSSKMLGLLIFTFLISVSLKAQEIVTGLQMNKIVSDEYNSATKLKSIDLLPAIQLPFFDDFSKSNIYPDALKWEDRNVLVNRDFAVFPPNTGVATFDVLDPAGAVYADAVSVPFVADYLTSRSIRLDSLFNPTPVSLSLADSVYLSFYYQPQGRADKPELSDSLVLQFGYPSGNMVLDYIDSVTVLVDTYLLENGIEYIYPFDTIFSPAGCNQSLYIINFNTLTWGDSVTLPCDSVMKAEIVWESVWNAEGASLEEFYQAKGKYFEQVMVSITDEKFFTSAFQFRFFNYGSIADIIIPSKRSNVDQWNLDFVYLNYDRSRHDTSFRMLSFSERAPSFLKRYESMPYRQYRGDPTNATSPDFKVFLTNLDNIEHNTKYRYKVRQVEGSFGFGYDGGSCNLPPFYTFGFQNCETGCGAAHACPRVNSLFALNFDRDTTSFVITHFISDSSGSNILVDSIRYTQGFYNYFAYDDGTPELGYGLEPAGGLLAYQFKMTLPDTLRGVQIYFNQTLNNANENYFDIVVWKDNNGKPGEEIYRKKRQKPVWSDQLYGFHQYSFDENIVINGVFYVGIMQEQSGSLNIGYDVAKNNQEYIFFNVDGVWRTSQYEGSLMIRPVVGSGMVIGIEDQESVAILAPLVYPNPAGNHLQIDLKDKNKQASAIIFDLSGRMVSAFSFRSGEVITLPSLTTGMYFLRIESEGHIFSSKLMITQ